MTHPITPSPEMVQQWIKECDNPEKPRWQEYNQDIANQSAQWGWDQRGAATEAELQKAADQELDACCEWLDFYSATSTARGLRTARRPKPPSLKEQALADLASMSIEPCLINDIDVNASVRAKYDTIRRALEALPNG